MTELQTLVEKKWTDRASSYCEAINAELNCFKRQAWLDLIQAQMPSYDRPVDVLDIGTGPGFFAIILSQIGWKVRAVDCTAEMIRHASGNAGHYGVEAEFAVMDSHKLDYPDDSFDLVLSRNVTWTLHHPEEAYKEWRRVLRPGGRLLIFDSNWYRHRFDEEARLKKEADEREARERFDLEPFKEPDQELAEAIYSSLPLGRYPRPDWDLERLPELGYSEVSVDRDLSGRIWDEQEQLLYRSTPMFMIRATA
ncbi:methyltransferase [Deltaproteobacteria bacterium Smac51]|nr:methyltransferase [Deltaproteobacteria bacterium Smac51]